MIGMAMLNGVRMLVGRCRQLRLGEPQPHFRRALRKHLEKHRQHPMYEEWFAYAASSLGRGREGVQFLRQFTPVTGQRCLDIGCAYGGFTIAFAEAGAATALGIELDESLLALARELLRDVPCRAEVRHADAMDGDFLRTLGTFDLITRDAVIEHVDDPWRLMEHFGLLLRPGGHLFLQIPNSRYLPAVLKDGHYGLFGITLLSRPRAVHYYQQVYSDPYTVGEYLPLAEYERTLAAQGIDCRCLNPVDHPETAFEKLQRGMSDLRHDYPGRLRELGVDEATRQDLSTALAAYLDEFAKAFGDYQAAADPAERQRRGTELQLTYLTEFWRLLAVKR